MSKIEWVKHIGRSNRAENVGPDEIYRSICLGNKQNGSKGWKASLRIGSDILKKMKWKEGDRLDIFFNPQDKYHWMICKSTSGFTLGRPNKQCNYLRIETSWRDELLEYPVRLHPVNHVIEGDKLIVSEHVI